MEILALGFREKGTHILKKSHWSPSFTLGARSTDEPDWRKRCDTEAMCARGVTQSGTTQIRLEPHMTEAPTQQAGFPAHKEFGFR